MEVANKAISYLPTLRHHAPSHPQFTHSELYDKLPSKEDKKEII